MGKRHRTVLGGLSRWPSVKAAADADVVLTERNPREMARLYLAGSAADNSMASPLLGEFSGLPPHYVQATGKNLLRDDGFRLQDAYAEQNPDLKLELFPEMLHSFQFFAGKMPEAGEAILKTAAFLEEKYAVLRRRDKTAG